MLDVLLPAIDGLEVCRRLRQQRVRTPILMVTARDAVPDRVAGLDAGPTTTSSSRLRSTSCWRACERSSRRAAPDDEGTVLRVGDLTLDPARHEAWRDSQPIDLTAKEFSLLEFLMRNAGQVLTKAQITDKVWGYDSSTTSNVVEIYVHYLRDKVDRGFSAPAHPHRARRWLHDQGLNAVGEGPGLANSYRGLIRMQRSRHP